MSVIVGAGHGHSAVHIPVLGAQGGRRGGLADHQLAREGALCAAGRRLAWGAVETGQAGLEHVGGLGSYGHPALHDRDGLAGPPCGRFDEAYERKYDLDVSTVRTENVPMGMCACASVHHAPDAPSKVAHAV